MIIDFHTHIFPDTLAVKTIPMLAQRSHTQPHTDGTAAGLLGHMEESGVDVSVVLPVVTAPRQFDSINRFAAQINEQESKKSSGPRLLSFGGIHPDNDNPKALLRQLKEQGFLGIKLHPDYQGVFINDIRNLRILEAAAELDLIVTIHAGVDIGLPEPVHCPPDKMREVFKQIPYSKIVLAHTGGWRSGIWWRNIWWICLCTSICPSACPLFPTSKCCAFSLPTPPSAVSLPLTAPGATRPIL